MPFVNPDEPTTEAEYKQMKSDLVHNEDREDCAFLMYEIDKYEREHGLAQSIDQKYLKEEMFWWQNKL